MAARLNKIFDGVLMRNQVAIVSVIGLESSVILGRAVFLNSELVSSTAPHMTDTTAELAASLAKAVGVDVVSIEHSISVPWGWDAVKADLIAKGDLMGGLQQFELTHTFLDQEAEESTHKMIFNALDYDHALEQLIESYADSPYRLISVVGGNELATKTLFQRGEAGYHLCPIVGSSCWVTVGSASVYLKQESEGVVIDVYPVDGEMEESVASTYALFAECVALQVVE